MRYPFGETITIVRTGTSPGRDKYGQPLPGPVTETAVPGCVVTPRPENVRIGAAPQQGRDTVITGWNVYAPPGTDIRTTDRLRIRGGLWEVTGETADWGRSPFTALSGPVEVTADRISG
ncbi:hypothetical protein ACFC0S_16760 [Streptomyces sp. NPDC056084]|uniref:hypothetical protein n=1 Tax=unclassified Streptomyces TaxID=2593676 RepID=UPI0035DC8D5C